MAPRTPRVGTALSAVTVGHLDFVLPLDKGLKLVALLKDAIEVDRDYAKLRLKTVYRRRFEQPEIGLEVLGSGQYDNDALAPGDDE